MSRNTPSPHFKCLPYTRNVAKIAEQLRNDFGENYEAALQITVKLFITNHFEAVNTFHLKIIIPDGRRGKL